MRALRTPATKPLAERTHEDAGMVRNLAPFQAAQCRELASVVLAIIVVALLTFGLHVLFR